MTPLTISALKFLGLILIFLCRADFYPWLTLEAEGIEVKQMQVSCGEYGWFPESIDLKVEE
ncbi:hypothetical protein JB92DRAFT_3065053 [Gautieria morchelliformis]|nr:hypothetical protein JB92DRAFT_3065053 [Gautieria morchelliformis]